MMFPASTEFGLRMPKQKFYEKLELSTALKRAFVNQIKLIRWTHKLAAATMNTAPGRNVQEIEVIRIWLNEPELDEGVLRIIDRNIPYHLLFLLEYDGKVQAWIGWKELANGKLAAKPGQSWHTEWMPEENLPLRIDGLDLDAIYENFIRQIAGEALSAPQAVPLKQSIELSAQKEKLRKKIDTLEKKMLKERQPRRQSEMYDELRKLRKEWEALEA